MSYRGFAYWDSGAALSRPAAFNVGDVIGLRKFRLPRHIGYLPRERQR